MDVLPFLDEINQLEFQPVNTNLTWAGEAAFIGESENGRTIVIDGPPRRWGKNLGAASHGDLAVGDGGLHGLRRVVHIEEVTQWFQRL